MKPLNFFLIGGLPHQGERFDQLLKCRNVIIERIVSSALREPVAYNQEQDEWVILMQGDARMELDGELISLSAGDSLFIPAHSPHRVVWTSGTPPCLWLAVHIHKPASLVQNVV